MRRRDRIHPLSAFLVRRRGAEDVRPQRPRIGFGASFWRARQQLELAHAGCTLTMHGAETVGARVAAADDDHVLVFRRDHRHLVAFTLPVLQRQILHREMNAGELTPRHRQIPGHRRAAREHDGLKSLAHLGERHVDADIGLRPEHDAFLLHQAQPAIEVFLFELEFRNAVAEQSADAIGALEHGDPVARAIQLIGGRQSGRTGADDGDALAGSDRRRPWHDSTVIERAFDDRGFDGLDRDR